jgi:hypothetical protein
MIMKLNGKLIFSLLGLLIASTQCSSPTSDTGEDQSRDVRALDIAKIETILGMKGTEKNGEYKITVPQNDLSIVVDSFKIIPPMGLGSWTAFIPTTKDVMIMGDIVVTETDLKQVQQEVINQGLTITAIHNHFLRDKPHVMYMHIGGMGTEEQLARSVKAVFAKVAEVRGKNPADGNKESVQNTLDSAALNKLLGSKGELSRGVLKHTMGRPDVDLKDHKTSVTSFAGFNTWASWQGTPEHAAVAGDFAMLEEEVAPVIKALVENGIEVVAVHNHMVHENPRIFFLHYWGVGPIDKLSQGLRQALDKTGKGKPETTTAAIFPDITEVICNDQN